eukprot:354894-Chlamydomonas_euryale.AAC.4
MHVYTQILSDNDSDSRSLSKSSSLLPPLHPPLLSGHRTKHTGLGAGRGSTGSLRVAPALRRLHGDGFLMASCHLIPPCV